MHDLLLRAYDLPQLCLLHRQKLLALAYGQRFKFAQTLVSLSNDIDAVRTGQSLAKDIVYLEVIARELEAITNKEQALAVQQTLTSLLQLTVVATDDQQLLHQLAKNIREVAQVCVVN